MKVVLTIDCDNEAFNGADCGCELSRILRRLVNVLEFAPKSAIGRRYRATPMRLRDREGNMIGMLVDDDYQSADS
jgi:hypothetical protein